MLTALIDLQNFEGVAVPALPVEWQTSGTGNNPWSTAPGASDSLPNHAFVPNAQGVSDSMLISPVFLASSQTSQVHFRNSYDTESGFDGGVLEISVNGGEFEDITVGGSFFAGGYIATLNSSFSNPLGGRAAWSGDSGGYIDTIANLPTTALGEPVQLRWRMATDANRGDVGWRIDTIRISPTNGSGIFASDTPSLLATRSNNVSLGDVDGDSDLDAFVVNGRGQGNRVWINQGGSQAGVAGSFSDSGQSLGAGFNGYSYDVSLGDLDGDGDLDAFVANAIILRNNVVWMNQGGIQGGAPGIFSESQRLGTNNSFGVHLGDLDGDGDLDAFVANDGANRIWMNQGGVQGGTAGAFSDSGQSLASFDSRDVSLGDVDGDGDLDAFVANRGRYEGNRVWLNQGGSQSGIPGKFSDSGQTLGSYDSRGVSLGDVDGDGDLDAFVANLLPRGNRVLINQGGTQGGTAGMFSDNGQSNLGGGREVSLGDLDGDGDQDAFIAVGGNLVLMNQGGVQGGTPGTFSDSGQTFRSFVNHGVSLGDVDGDGDLDAISVNALSPNRVLTNHGGAQGGTPGLFSDSGQSLGSFDSDAVSLGDLDGDGDLDAVFVVNSTNDTGVLINQGGAQGGMTGTFADSGQNLKGGSGVSLGDLDGDGDLDAFVVDDSDGNRVLINQSGMQGGTAGIFSDSGQTFRRSSSIGVHLGDLDDDGDLDAFVIHSSSASRVWLNQGGSQSGTPGTFSDSVQSLGASAEGVSLGDLDGDGDLDVFVAEEDRPSRVWINEGGVQGGTAGNFSDSGQRLGGPSFGVSLGDVDDDGDLDAFVANHSRGNRVWINQRGLQGGAAGVFKDSNQSLGSFDSRDVSLGDVDGDGDLDAFVVGAAGNSAWLNQNLDFGDAPQTFGTTLASNGARHIPTGPSLGASRDSEADGQQSADASGDDAGHTGAVDDEDGVTSGTVFVGQSDATATVDVAIGAGKLDAWIDFNNDGQFDELGERIADSLLVAVGDNSVVFDVPAAAVTGQPLVARFRLSTDGGLGPLGAALDGEVEDHTVNLTSATVTDHSINGIGNSNRSGVANLVLQFDGPATVSGVTALSFLNHTTGAPLDISAAVLQNNGTAVLTWDFSNTSFPDGYYTAVLSKEAGTVAATHTVVLHVLAGDSNGNAQVDFADFGDLANNFNTIGGPIYGPGDVDGNGNVDFNDFGILANSFNTVLTIPTLDFGDAPEAGNVYPTTLVKDGARHILGSNLVLGAIVDGEVNGQPNATSTGDGVDEDGVTFGALRAGDSSASVTVTISSSAGTGLLNAWIDFNADGDWDDVGEQVFVDQTVKDGPNNLMLAISPSATVGPTFTRFRLTSIGGYSYQGLAADGEVEDYSITIVASKLIGLASQGSSELVLPMGLFNNRSTTLPSRFISEDRDTRSVELTRTDVVDQAFKEVDGTERRPNRSRVDTRYSHERLVDQVLEEAMDITDAVGSRLQL